jgi:hypothetical protein
MGSVQFKAKSFTAKFAKNEKKTSIHAPLTPTINDE